MKTALSKRIGLATIMIGIFFAIFFILASVAQAQLCANLTWVDNSSAPNAEDGFTMERNLNGGPWSVVASAIGANITAYNDCTLVQGTTQNIYTYRVRAFNAAGVSAWSNTASKTVAPILTVPGAPTGLTVSAISKQTLETSWANNTPEASTELVRRPANNDAFTTIATLAPTKSVHRQMRLPSRTTFCYKARAVLSGQVSEFSELSCATTK